MDRSIILRTELERERAVDFLRRLNIRCSPPWELVMQRLRAKRSLDQNARYWAIMREISDQLMLNDVKYSGEAIHEWAKRTFIGCNEVAMPDGQTALFGISTTTLSVGEFGDFMTQLEVWAIEHGVVFSDDAARTFRELAERAA